MGTLGIDFRSGAADRGDDHTDRPLDPDAQRLANWTQQWQDWAKDKPLDYNEPILHDEQGRSSLDPASDVYGAKAPDDFDEWEAHDKWVADTYGPEYVEPRRDLIFNEVRAEMEAEKAPKQREPMIDQEGRSEDHPDFDAWGAHEKWTIETYGPEYVEPRRDLIFNEVRAEMEAKIQPKEREPYLDQEGRSDEHPDFDAWGAHNKWLAETYGPEYVEEPPHERLAQLDAEAATDDADQPGALRPQSEITAAERSADLPDSSVSTDALGAHPKNTDFQAVQDVTHPSNELDRWSDPETRRAWVEEWKSNPEHVKAVTATAEWATYQREHAGDVEVQLKTADEITEIWADGLAVDPDTVVAVEAKYVVRPGRSMYEGAVPEFMLDDLMEGFDYEMKRYADVARDIHNPVDRIRIVTNTEPAMLFLGERARRIVGDGVDIDVVLRPVEGDSK